MSGLEPFEHLFGSDEYEDAFDAPSVPDAYPPGGSAHECGWDYDPRCDGCRVAYGDAGEPA